MTWLVLTDVTQKIHSVSGIRSTLDPKQRNLSLDPTSSTDFKMLDNNPSVPEESSLDPDHAVYFAHDGGNTSPTMVDRFRSVMVDENGEPRKGEKGELLYETGPHPNDLPGKVFLQPDKDTNLPTHMTVGECLDDFDTKLKNNEVRKIRCKVRFT